MKLHNKKLILTLRDLFLDAPDIDAWTMKNIPDADLIYKSGQTSQQRKIKAVQDIVNLKDPPKVLSSHKSKSVPLPVVGLNFGFYANIKAFGIIRDNFYDIKLGVVSHVPINIPYEFVHYRMTQEEYEEKKQKSLSWAKPEELPLYESDAWYSKYTGGSLIRRNNELWIHGSVKEVYCEGFRALNLPKEMFMPYTEEATIFTLSVPTYSKLAVVLDHVNYSLSKGQSQYSSEKYNGQIKKTKAG